MSSSSHNHLLLELTSIAERLLSLSPPTGQFIADRLPSRPWIRVGVGTDGLAALLPTAASTPRPTVELAHLRIRFNIECALTTSEGDSLEKLILIECLSDDASLQRSFLQLLSILLPSTQSVHDETLDASVRHFAELFRTLQTPPLTTALGLWGELFLLATSADVRFVANRWHTMPNDRYDLGTEYLRVEVKTTTGERAHKFSLEQLSPPEGARVLIASIITAPFVSGPSIASLVDRICETVDHETGTRVLTTAMKSLGREWQNGQQMRFDEQLARETLSWYDSKDVPSVGQVAPGVTEVRFRASLNKVRASTVRTVRESGELGIALVGTH